MRGETCSMAVHKQKLRMFYVYQILKQETDEEHILSAADIIHILISRYDIFADRRSIYSDIETLVEAGVDIITVKGNLHGYFMGSRLLEFPELMMMIDSVQVTPSISERRSRDLIDRLEKLTSKYKAKQLHQQVILMDRPKTQNETVLYAIDKLHAAIYRRKQVSFQYVEWTVRKEHRILNDGECFYVNPCALTWIAESYYLMGIPVGGRNMKFYRIDKMIHLQVEDTDRETVADGRINPTEEGKKFFGTSDGKVKDVTLRCDNCCAGSILDRFGTDIMIVPEDELHFHVTLPIAVSAPFYGWVASFGSKMTIAAPIKVREGYRTFLQEAAAPLEEEAEEENG